MRIILCMVLCLLMTLYALTGCINTDSVPFDMDSIDKEVVNRNTQFAFGIFRELNKDDKTANIFISPLSISTALSMTYQGARGTTRDAMAEALKYEGIDINTINRFYRNLLRYLEQADSKVELNISNSIWIRRGEKIKEEFLTVNRDAFNAYIEELDFSREDTADRINSWINSSTKGKIQKMLESPISPQVVMYLINAIYFKGQWSQQFDIKNTFESEFYAVDGTKKDIMMMSREGSAEYTEGDNYKAVRLPYGSGNISMYCILPDEDININDFIEDMNADKWNTIRQGLSKTEDVILQLPRFKVEYGIKNLNDSLTSLGMGEAFSGSADFSGIRDGIFISRVLHKAVIDVNEEGSEAAGVTVVEMAESAAMEPITFIANRPFLFIIADDKTGAILFTGKFCDLG